MRSLFGGDTYESDNDERLDKKFSYNYQVIKRMYPKASELPEEEVREIIRQYYQAPKGQEEQAIKDYIRQKEPEWHQLYGLDYEDKEEVEDANSFWQPMQNNDFWGGYDNRQNTSSSTIQPMTEQEHQKAKTLASQIRPEIPNTYTDYLAQNTADMLYGAGRALNGLTGGGLDYLGDRYGIDTRMEDYLAQKDKEGTGELAHHLGNRDLIADYKEIVKNIMKKAYEDYPVVKIGDAAGTLHAAKKEMDKTNLINSDNYYHRLGMCLNGQKGLDSAIYSLGWGLLKEGYDIARKTYNGNNLADTLTDSFKDMQNNVEGLRYGLTNPDKSCRIWLNDLDINTNSWKTDE